MNGLLLAQLSWVALRDAEAIEDHYAWPPRAPLSDEEQREARRLRSVSARLSYRARATADGPVFGQGTDECFGGASAELP